MSTTLALVPLRSPGEGKTRLASVLGTTARAELAGAMLADVIRALTAAGVDRPVVVASGPAAAAAAAALGVDVVTDPPDVRTLDDAIRTAAARFGPADELLVTMADLPCLTATDVTALLATTAPVGLAATTDGGTGGLIRRPAEVMPTAYGPASAARHLDLARAHGLDCEVVASDGFARDVDTAADLTALRGWPTGPATHRWLGRHHP